MRLPGRFALMIGLFGLLVAEPGQAHEIGRSEIRIGDHKSFSRLVISVSQQTAVTWSRKGDEVVIVSDALIDQTPEGNYGPGITSVSVQNDRLTLLVLPRVEVHSFRLNNRLVFDVIPQFPKMSLARQRAYIAASDVKILTAPQGGVLPGLPAPMVAVVDGLNPPFAAPRALAQISQQSTAISDRTAPASTGGAVSQTLSIVASLVPASPDQPSGLLLPFDGDVGAAAFVRAGRLEVVFDSQKPIDLSGIASDPTFGQARLRLLSGGATLDLPCAASCRMELRRVADGWLLAPVQGGAHPIDPQTVEGGLMFPVAEAGHVLVVVDPAGGGDILVGTVRKGGQSTASARRAPGFRLVPSLLGVAVERVSDLIDLKLNPIGFLLIDPYQATGASRPNSIQAFSRSVELSPVETAEQWRRYKAALADAASRPPGSRRPARLEASRAALALGLGREARRLATIADADAPGGAEQAQSAFLAAAGAYQADDPDAAMLLNDARIGNSDEALLWRSLALARKEPDNHAAARAIAARLGLLLSYPDGIRKALAGEAALSLARGGDETAQALVVGLGGDRGKVGLARALIAERGHRDPAALGSLDRLAADDDPEVALQAVREAIETRLQAGMISPAVAAELLARHIYDARMAGREFEVVMRVSELKARAADWSGALADLRTASLDFPDAMPAIRHAVGEIIRTVSGAQPQANEVWMASSGVGKGTGSQVTDPISAAALLENYQDLLPDDTDRAALSVGLAGRLAALDLPDRAAGFLSQAIEQSQTGAERSRDGLALTRLLLDEGDAKAAQAALEEADRSGVPQGMEQQRSVLAARVLAANGDSNAALATLAPLQGRDVLELRATLLAEQKNWPAVVPVLQAMLANQVPSGPHGRIALDADAQDLVLRLASAMAQSGQKEALSQLNRDWAPGFTDLARRDMLGLLAAPEVRSLGDLARSGADLASTRNALTVLDGPGAPVQRQPPS